MLEYVGPIEMEREGRGAGGAALVGRHFGRIFFRSTQVFM